MQGKNHDAGFTLVELMIAIGVLAVIMAIGLPTYQGYIETSREGVLVNNIHTIELFQEDFRLRTGGYAFNLADIAAIEAAIGWNPNADDGVTYAIGGNANDYTVTATSPDGVVVCMTFPDKTRCP